jgi:outer membrane protein TolC
MKKGTISLLVLLLFPWISRAQEAPARVFTLQEAITFALEHNKQLKASAMNIDLYREKIREAISQGLPQVNGTLDYSTNFNHEMSFGESMNITMKDQSNAKLAVQQLLFSGQWITGVQASRIARELAERQVDASSQEIVESVSNSYYNILASERLLSILDRNLQLMNESFEHAREMFEAGVKEETEVDQLRVSVGQLKNTRLSMQRTLEVTYTLLRVQLGVDNNTSVTLSDDLSHLVNPGESHPSPQSFRIEDNLQYRLAATQVEINEKLLGIEKWSYAPTLSALYSYTYKIVKPELDMSPKHAAGVTLSIPLFSGLQRKAKVEQARVTLQQSLVNKSLLEDQLALQDNQLRFELKNALENYRLQEENIKVANRVLDSYKRKYELGAISSLELTQANTTYLQAEDAYTSAMLTLLQARLHLEKLYNLLPYKN